MLRHAARRGLLLFADDDRQANRLRYELDEDMRCLIDDYQAAWLARNRRGGLADSVGRLEKARAEYLG